MPASAGPRIRTRDAQAIPSTSRSWGPQHSALNNGQNNNWVPAHYAADGPKNFPYIMGYYEEQDIPFQRALAAAFTILDSGFCSVLGPTHPNRYMWMTGTVDPTAENGGPALDNNITNGAYTWKTYAESLDEAGVSWKCYQGADNYGTNAFVASKIDAIAANPEVWAKNRLHPHLRRERRPVRPRPADHNAGRDRGRVRDRGQAGGRHHIQQPVGRPWLPGAHHHRLPVDRGRLGVQRAV
jgi:phospholipase C